MTSNDYNLYVFIYTYEPIINIFYVFIYLRLKDRYLVFNGQQCNVHLLNFHYYSEVQHNYYQNPSIVQAHVIHLTYRKILQVYDCSNILMAKNTLFKTVRVLFAIKSTQNYITIMVQQAKHKEKTFSKILTLYFRIKVYALHGFIK